MQEAQLQGLQRKLDNLHDYFEQVLDQQGLVNLQELIELELQIEGETNQ